MQSWENTVKRLKSLPEQEMKVEIDILALVWYEDYDIIKSLASDKEISFSFEEYLTSCRNQLQETFGYSSFL